MWCEPRMSVRVYPLDSSNFFTTAKRTGLGILLPPGVIPNRGFTVGGHRRSVQSQAGREGRARLPPSRVLRKGSGSAGASPSRYRHPHRVCDCPAVAPNRRPFLTCGRRTRGIIPALTLDPLFLKHSKLIAFEA